MFCCLAYRFFGGSSEDYASKGGRAYFKNFQVCLDFSYTTFTSIGANLWRSFLEGKSLLLLGAGESVPKWVDPEN